MHWEGEWEGVLQAGGGGREFEGPGAGETDLSSSFSDGVLRVLPCRGVEPSGSDGA